MRRRRRTPRLRGRVAVPGDKSISHRALILGALAGGPARLGNLNPGADVAATAEALGRMGAALSRSNHQVTVEVEGSRLREPTDVLDAGNSGTTARLLMGVAASIAGCSFFTGDATLRRRPMARVTAPLEAMGATIVGRASGSLLPLLVAGGSLRGVVHDTEVASAQVKSALLLAGLGAEGRTVVREPAPSRDHTERMLASLGVPVAIEPGAVAVTGGARPAPLELDVPGDISAALYLVAAALLVEGSDLTVAGVGLNPTRIGGLEVLRRMGADVSWEVTEERCGEPVGAVRARFGMLAGTVVTPDEIPRLIDEIPILAVVATQSEGLTSFTGAGELRVKESDRIASVGAAIRALGGAVEERSDGLVVEGPTRLTGGVVEARGDHRIALSFAIAGLVAAGAVRIEGWSASETSFPGFLEAVRAAQRR